MERCSPSTVLKYLLENEPGVDYVVNFTNEREISVSGELIRLICGTQRVSLNLSDMYLVMLLTFLGDGTRDLFAKYIELTKKARSLRIPTLLVLDDCGREFVAYLAVLCKALKLVGLSEAMDIATATVMLPLRAKAIKEYRDKELSEGEYLDYQRNLEEVTKYMSKLTKVLPSVQDIEDFLGIAEESLEKGGDVVELFTRLLGDVLGSLPSHLSVLTLRVALNECPYTLLEALQKLYSRFKSSRREVYVVVPMHIAGYLRGVIPDHVVIGL